MIWDIAAVILVLACLGQYIFLSALGREYSKTGKIVVQDDFPRVSQKTETPVSVLICAKNEAPNLRRHLPSILSQDYLRKGELNFEVIVVDDASDDETAAVLAEFLHKWDHLRVVTISADEPRIFPGKKFALSKAVAKAQFDHLLMTDADCRPASPHWIRRMASPFIAGKKINAGYGAYHSAPGLLNRFIRCETVLTFLQLHGMALGGTPYMAVGRNLAVEKHIMLAAQQDPLWIKSPSGDDDLLVRLYATPDNYFVNTAADSFTQSNPKPNLREYVLQKQRHLSTGKYYKREVKILLGLNGLSHTLFWCALPVWLAGNIAAHWQLAHAWGITLLVLLRFGQFYLIMETWIGKLNEKGLLLFVPFFDVLLALYNIFFSPYILWKTKARWR